MPPPFDSFSVSGEPVEFTFSGVESANQQMDALYRRSPPAMAAALNELGLLLEHNIKPYVRVRTGRLRSSIGHFTPNDLTDKADSRVAREAAEDAYFRPPTIDDLAVSVGTRVRYAPHVNYQLGDLYMERGLQDTIDAVPRVVLEYLQAING